MTYIYNIHVCFKNFYFVGKTVSTCNSHAINFTFDTLLLAIKHTLCENVDSNDIITRFVNMKTRKTNCVK